MSSSPYKEPVALIVISSISIGIAAVAALWIALDIILRRGWKSMMFIMIPVYVINALYLWPITLWTYLKYGRPPKPNKSVSVPPQSAHQPPHAGARGREVRGPHDTIGGDIGRNESSPTQDATNAEVEKGEPGEEEKHGHGGGDHKPDSSGGEGGRPMFATITIGVCHCGAGCVLGDIVGEWLVYSTNALIGSPGRLLWAEFLVGKYPNLLFITRDVNLLHRLWLCLCLWYHLSIFLDRSNGRRIWTPNSR